MSIFDVTYRATWGACYTIPILARDAAHAESIFYSYLTGAVLVRIEVRK